MQYALLIDSFFKSNFTNRCFFKTVFNSFVVKNLEMMITKQEVDRKLVSGSVDPLTGNTPIMFAAIENKVELGWVYRGKAHGWIWGLDKGIEFLPQTLIF